MPMSKNNLNFQLPDELIAQQPVSPRDHAKLLVYRRADQSITDAIFYQLPDYLSADTTLVLNQAKVDKCRLRFGSTEVFLLQTINDKTVEALVRPGKKFKLGKTIQLTDEISAHVDHINSEGHRTLTFNRSLNDQALEQYKLTPLPPYIAQDESLAEEYQTVFAKDTGSKAAPTAGLHFTPELLSAIASKHQVVRVTLNVGLGTFAPLSEDNLKTRSLHSESYSISRQAASQLNSATHVTAVGTTTTRLLESAYRTHRSFVVTDHAQTSIFIQPDDDIQSIDSLVTNFHLPGTSLLMMVAALTGEEELLRIYQHAISQRYRFYSFGDAMLIQ